MLDVEEAGGMAPVAEKSCSNECVHLQFVSCPFLDDIADGGGFGWPCEERSQSARRAATKSRDQIFTREIKRSR